MVTRVEVIVEVIWCFYTFAKIRRLAKGLHYILFIEHYLEIHEGLHFAKYMISQGGGKRKKQRVSNCRFLRPKTRQMCFFHVTVFKTSTYVKMHIYKYVFSNIY